MDRSFPKGLTEEEEEAIEKQKLLWRTDAERMQINIAGIGGSGYGNRSKPSTTGRPQPASDDTYPGLKEGFLFIF